MHAKETFYDVMRRHGVTRRSFLKFCSLTAAGLGLGPEFVGKIAHALETKPRTPVIWLHGLGADGNDFAPIVPYLGLDGTGPASFDAIWEFVQHSGLYEVQITIATAFPGTPLYDRLCREGRIILERAWDLCTLFDVNFQPQQMTAAQLEQGFRNLAERLYSAEATSARRAGFHRNLRLSSRPPA